MQVVGIPVAEEYGPYLDEIIDQLKTLGVRAEVDHSNDRMCDNFPVLISNIFRQI